MHSVAYEVVEIDAEKVVVQMTEEFRNGDVEKMRQDVEALQPFVAPLREVFSIPKSLSQLSHTRVDGFGPKATRTLSKDAGGPKMATVLLLVC